MFENFEIEVCEVFKKAEKEREVLKHEYVGTEHLLLAILSRDSSLSSRLAKMGIFYDNFLEEVKNTLSSSSKKVKDNIYTPLLKRVIVKAMDNSKKVSEESLLYFLLDEGEGVAIRLLIGMDVDVDALYNSLKSKVLEDNNLEIYKIGKLLNEHIDLNDKVIGRDKEINLIIETLLRKKKNNPLLIGDAGVGKSAIVEELARKIVNGEVPETIKKAKIVMLEMGSLVSGTRYRGEFEERLTNIVDELNANKNIILFIDEMHSMVNAGAADGAICASDILKPYLARGDIKCIGATTKNEYEKYIACDKALARRFETILVKEPSEEETFNILSKIKDEYINFHKINVDDETIRVLVHLAGTYFPNRKNPDKSIELLDSVMSYVKLKECNELIKAKEKELRKIELSKIREVENGNYKSALKKNIEENKVKKEIISLKKDSKVSVTKDDIIDVLEYKNNIIISDKKINFVAQSMSKNYDKKIIKQVSSLLKNKFRTTTLLLRGEVGSFVEDLASAINYDVIKLSDSNCIDKMFQKIKYSPSSIVLVEECKDFIINNLLKKITKDNIVEYKDEYISFNNSLIVIIDKGRSIGFNQNGVSLIPIDEIICFEKNVLV